MRVFLSYASEDLQIAEELALQLSGKGRSVFFDRSSLVSAEDYHARIADEVRACDLFVFLVSAHCLEPGAYTLTELGYAQKKWPSPLGRVLPAVIDETPTEELPAYACQGQVFRPRGNRPTEIATEAENCLRKLEVGLVPVRRVLRDVLFVSLGALAVTIIAITAAVEIRTDLHWGKDLLDSLGRMSVVWLPFLATVFVIWPTQKTESGPEACTPQSVAKWALVLVVAYYAIVLLLVTWFICFHTTPPNPPAAMTVKLMSVVARVVTLSLLVSPLALLPLRQVIHRR